MEQIFLLEELKNIQFETDKLDEWKNLINGMELNGQKKLLSEKDNIPPIPFLYLNEGMYRILTTLLPTKTKYNEYSNSPIPLKVLSILKMAVDANYFTKILVFHSDEKSDPALVGVTQEKINYSWGSNIEEKFYLIAKWGDALKSWEVMEHEAIEILKKKCISEYNNIQNKINSSINSIDNSILNFLKGKGSIETYFSFNL